MTKVYQVMSEGLSGPVTIVARNADDAFANFWVWREKYAGDLQNEPAEVVEMAADDLAKLPQLADAALGGLVGVAQWLDRDRGWIVLGPTYDLIGHFAPPPSEVRCFMISGSDYPDMRVFAETRERAVATFHLYSLDANGWEGDYDQVREIPSTQLTGALSTLIEGMEQGLTGIGHQCDDGNWRIFPADYDFPIVRRTPRE